MASPDKTTLAGEHLARMERLEKLEAEVVRLRQDNKRLLAEQAGREPTYYIGKLQERIQEQNAVVERLRKAIEEALYDLSSRRDLAAAKKLRAALVASPDKPPEDG